MKSEKFAVRRYHPIYWKKNATVTLAGSRWTPTGHQCDLSLADRAEWEFNYDIDVKCSKH